MWASVVRRSRNKQLLLSCFMSLAVEWCQSEAGGGSQWGQSGPLALWDASSGGRGSETSNWTTTLWTEKCWGSKRCLFHWFYCPYCALSRTRRCGIRQWTSDWLYYLANIVPKLRFTHHCQLFCFIPHSFFSSRICDQFVQFMCHKLVCVLKAACVCTSPCRSGCWWTDLAPGFLRFLSVEASDKGKWEVRRGLSVLTAVCCVDGLRWMFEHQTDIKKQMDFMSNKIYPLNKHCRVPPGWIYSTWHTKRAQFRHLAEVPGTFTQRKPEILALF